MIKFAVRHMAIRKGKNVLIAISIVITLTVSLLAYNIANQVKDGFINSYKYYDTIIGPAGSQTQLVLNTLFYTDKPLGLISYEEYEKLLNNPRISIAIPFAEGDNYNNVRIVGTNVQYLDEFTIKKGKPFSDIYEVVIGYNLAKNLKIGNTFYSVHGLTTDINSHEHSNENQKYTVVGILAKTNTATDNVIFTDIKSVWFNHGDPHDDDDPDEEEHERGITAMLIKCRDFSSQGKLSDEYNKIAGMQAVNPSAVMRELMTNIDLSKNIVYILCGIILIMNLFIICVITMLNMADIKKDIILLRLIGVSKTRIKAIIYIQNSINSGFSVIIGFIVSRLLMLLIGGITQNMGIVLNTNKFYNFEFVITFIVVVTIFVPIIISIKKIFMEGILNEN